MALYVDIQKHFSDFDLDVCFDTKENIYGVLGESGCGKSMTLKCIAGIERPDRGKIVLNGRILFDSEKKIDLPPQKRNVGYLFQDYALFPNMTVIENIKSGMKKKISGKEKNAYARKLMNRFFLDGMEKKYPSMLSGGQRQRTAIARVLSSEPEIILLDEPFSALDSYLKWQLELEILNISEEYGKELLLVSHNRDEIYRLCQEMGVISKGHMEISGGKKELFKNPKTVATALLTGCKNISPMKKEDNHIFCTDWNLRFNLTEPVHEDITHVGIHAHYIKVTEPDTEKWAEIERVIEAPFENILLVRIKDRGGNISKKTLRIGIEKERSENLVQGRKIGIMIPSDVLLLLSEKQKR